MGINLRKGLLIMIATYGEIMLRISPSNKGEKLIQTKNFTIEPGGSESNVAIALANLGNRVTFITKIPDNALGQKILQYLREFNVDTSYIVFSKDRIGLYWTENGVGHRASNVIYDRSDSAISKLEFLEIDKTLFDLGINWFHVSGITPAISEISYRTLTQVLNHLDKRCQISVDLNYRSKLWNWVDGKSEIHRVMSEICKNTILLTGNETDFQNSLGYCTENTLSADIYSNIAQEAFSKSKNLRYLAISIRESHSASENTWSGMLFCKENGKLNCYRSPKFFLTDIVDRVGTGDSFTGGIIHGLNNFSNDYQRIIEFAVAHSVLNHSIIGDASYFFPEDVEHLIATKGSGRIIR